jgi:hippurate hydrolase
VRAARAPNGPPLPSLHSSKYYPDPVPTIQTGVRSLTTLVLSLLDARE